MDKNRSSSQRARRTRHRSPVTARQAFAQHQDRPLIPSGVATLLPEAAHRLRHLEGVLLSCLGQWGYREVIPPTFEYLDVISTGLAPEVLEKCYKFADWTTGRILVLRPDVTAQIARIVAMGMGGSGLPLRLCYRTTVFRYEPEHAGREREIFQVGAELIGDDSPGLDAEIVAVMVECLKRLGLQEFKVSLGHMGVFTALLTRSGMSDDGRKRAKLAAARKDLPKLERILHEERVAKRVAHAIIEAPGLYGQEEVLARGRALLGESGEVGAALNRLTQVYEMLASCGMKSHLFLDLGEFRGFDYYDGMVCDVFAGNLGTELGGGGRYNHLLGRFGWDVPSTGFAFNVDRLFRVLDALEANGAGGGADILLAGSIRDFERAYKLAQRLRQDGFRVIHETMRPMQSSQLSHWLARGRELAVSKIVVMGASRCRADEVLLSDLPSARWKKVNLEALKEAL